MNKGSYIFYSFFSTYIIMSNIDLSRLRKYKLGDYVILDVVLTFLAAYLLSILLAPYGISRRKLFLLAIPASIVIHKLVGAHTTLTDRFFNPHDFYILKLSIVYLTYRGLTTN